MTLEDDDGYEWHEVTSATERAAGRRTFLRGKRLDRASELEQGIRALINEVSDLDHSEPSRERVIEKLRGLL